jgi:hypothetical protein
MHRDHKAAAAGRRLSRQAPTTPSALRLHAMNAAMQGPHRLPATCVPTDAAGWRAASPGFRAWRGIFLCYRRAVRTQRSR